MNSTITLISIFILYLTNGVYGFHYSSNPLNNAFFLFSPSQPRNYTHRVLYLPGDCPSSVDQQVTVTTGVRSETTRLFSAIPNLHCAVTVKIVQDVVYLDRPYVDVLAIADTQLLAFLKQSACVTVQLTSSTADTVSSSCHLTAYDAAKSSCVIRINVPFLWFGTVASNSSRQTLSISHTVSSTCNIPFYDRPQTTIDLLSSIANAQAHTLVKNSFVDLSLLSKANLTMSPNSMNSLLVHMSLNATDENVDRFDVKLWLDSRVEIVAVKDLSHDWSIRVVSAERPLYFTTFVCTRLNATKTWDGYLFVLLLKYRGSNLDSKRLQNHDHIEEATLHWEVKRPNAKNASSDSLVKVATKFRIAADSVYAVVPVAKNTDIVNSGILSGQQVSSPMRVYTVTTGGVIRDVTSQSHCISAEARVLKTSPTCTTVYVDGTEVRGSAEMKIHVHFEKWTTHISFTVWYPRLPITLWLQDPILNSISTWPITVWKSLKEHNHERSGARQFGCGYRYQQTELRVLASFQVGDERTGERMFLSGHRDFVFDVTAIAAASVQSVDRSIVSVRNVNGRVLVQGLRAGSTKLALKSHTSAVDFGSSTVIVSDDPVTVTAFVAIPVVSMSINIDQYPGQRAKYNLLAGVESTFTHRYQHGSLFYQLQYSDESVELLDDVVTSDYTLNAESSDDRVIAVSRKANNNHELIAVDDLSDSFVSASLRAPSHCVDSDLPPLATAQVLVEVRFGHPHTGRFVTPTSNVTLPAMDPTPPSAWRMDRLLAIVLVLILIIAIIKFTLSRTHSFSGYEKLVAPLLSRLSSSSSGGRDEDTKEWVWLSRARIDSNSIDSRYSQKSTKIAGGEQSSPSYDDNTQTSISYRGSEISVFISPTPVVTVNCDRPAGGSWRTGGRTRAARAALVDSASDHNLARVVARTGSWRDEPYYNANHTWNSKRRQTQQPAAYCGNGMLRESVA